METYPVRGQHETTASYEIRVQDWRARNTLPSEKIVPPTGGTLTTLKPRQPSGHYTNNPPSTSAIPPKP